MKINSSYTSTIEVSKSLTAETLGSGDMQVLATPAMIALMENAAMLCVKDQLEEGDTTVGTMINASHTKPSSVGATIKATATLIEEEGRKLTFNVKAEDENGTIGEGIHIRYVVTREKFLSKLK